MFDLRYSAPYTVFPGLIASVWSLKTARTLCSRANVDGSTLSTSITFHIDKIRTAASTRGADSAVSATRQPCEPVGCPEVGVAKGVICSVDFKIMNLPTAHNTLSLSLINKRLIRWSWPWGLALWAVWLFCCLSHNSKIFFFVAWTQFINWNSFFERHT